MTIKTIQWIYILEEDYSYNIKHHLPKNWNSGYAFLDKTGVKRFEIHPDGTAKVLKGYAWDGCTPKWAIADILIGTPDGAPNPTTQKPKTYYASLLHDVLCQFLDVNPDIPRATADKIFLEILENNDFAPRRFYYLAVMLFGKISQYIKRTVRKHDGRREELNVVVPK